MCLIICVSLCVSLVLNMSLIFFVLFFCVCVQLYDLASGSELSTILVGFPVSALTVDPLGSWLAVGGVTGTIALLPLFLPVSGVC